MTDQQHYSCCRGDALEEQLCTTIAELKPLYATDFEDRSDSLLGDYPDTTHIVEALRILVDAMFPGRMFHAHVEQDELSMFLTRRLSEAWRYLRPEIERALPFRWLGEVDRHNDAVRQIDVHAEAFRIMSAFYTKLPAIRTLLVEDVRAAYDGDPAALNYAEVQLAYPGMLAITSHRIAHELYKLEVPVVPRIMSEWTHSKTGVDIHPGASIGHGFFIDHATGVVIGETTEIGDHVKIYQGVTLGAKSFPLDEQGHPIKKIKRHPTVEDRVVIYANAIVLGGDTVIGHGSTIGGSVFLMESVPPNSFVTNKRPELHIKTH